MKIYQVGGAVRDRLLGLKPTDIDYVVIGSTVQEMLNLGFKPVGKRFPVFLHPETKAEYALARKEIKTGNKHTDFQFIFDPTITLEDDIIRRDFTINALVQEDENSPIIDLVNGVNDLNNHLIRHIDATHFIEDPLRILRMCRFAAQLNFNIHPDTMILTQQMVKEGMLQHLSKERIFQEIEKAFSSAHADIFIEKMRECGALKVLLPEIEKLFTTPEKIIYHPEKTSGAHTILALKAGKNYSPEIQFAILLHDVGKAETPTEILPSHYGHDKRGEALVNNICKRLKIPNKYKEMALLGAKMHMKLRDVPYMRLTKLFDFVNQISNKFKDETKIKDLFLICQADMMGRAIPLKDEEFENFELAKNRVMRLFSLMQEIKITDMPLFQEMKKDASLPHQFKTYALEVLKTKMD